MRSIKHALCVFTATLAGLAIAQPETTTTAEVDSPKTPVLELNGKTVLDEDLTSFAVMLESTEMRAPEDGQALLNEFILTRLHSELKTTATSVGAKKRDLPTAYAGAGQRQVLRREFQEHVRKNLDVPRSEMEKWYQENLPNYTQPLRVRAYHLFMETSKDEASSSPEKVRERISAVKAQADKGTSFGLLARQHSEAASGRQGGEIGLVSPRMPIGPQSQPMNPKLENALFSLEPGQVSDIVQTSHGLHLLYAAEKMTTQTPTLDDLITSGILPGAVARDLLTSEVRTQIAQTIERHKGKVAEITSGTQAELTTSTAAYELGGKTYTVADLEEMYGPRFTRAWQRTAGRGGQQADLMKQALEDEALIQAAVDAGLDKAPHIKKELEILGQRSAAVQKVSGIIAEHHALSDEKLRAEYDKMKESLRQPEGQGEVLMVSPKDGSSPAEIGKFRELAKKKADEAHAKLKAGETFEEVNKWLNTQDVQSSSTKVDRHVLGQAMDTLGRAFDQATAGLNGENVLSEVVPFGNDYAIARLAKREMGDPVPFDRIRPRLQAQVQAQNDGEARKALVEQLVKDGKVKYLPGAAKYRNANKPAESH